MKNLRYFRKIIFFILIFILPFNARHIFNYEAIKNIESFRENITFFLAPFDIGMLLIISTFIWEKPKKIISKYLSSPNIYISFLVLVFVLIFSSLLAFDQKIAFYNTIRAVEGVVFFFIAKEIFSKNARIFVQGVYVVFVTGIFQAIMAIFQFIFQKSVGLFILGESHISPAILGVAKIEHGGEKLIRGYGTFSHPNILGAFLLASLICGIFLLVRGKQKSFLNKIRETDLTLFAKKGLVFLGLENFSVWIFHLIVGLFLIASGIFITFSRSVWLGFTIIVVFAFLKWVIVNRHRFPVFNYSFFGRMSPKEKPSLSREEKILFRDALFLGVLYLIILLVFILPFVTDRLCLKDCGQGDNSYQIRREYAKTAMNVIKDNPILGIGPGNFVIKIEDYAPTKLNAWEKQPVHSLYFLIASEIGIIGLIVLVYFIIYNIKCNLFKYLFGMLFVTFLLLGIFDHFFASTFQGQLLFWLCLAFFTSSCKIKKKNLNFDNF